MYKLEMEVFSAKNGINERYVSNKRRRKLL